ncbi:MAG: hypothetical protein L0Z55_10550 [Planctomycetes bacterium]|nr:hypothetical protein [Planctomycetota bacterium]
MRERRMRQGMRPGGGAPGGAAGGFHFLRALVTMRVMGNCLWPLLVALLATPEPPTLDARIALVLPRPGELRWLEIPWRTDLLAARAEAAFARKPLFLWVMNGHPLGCT